MSHLKSSLSVIFIPSTTPSSFHISLTLQCHNILCHPCIVCVLIFHVAVLFRKYNRSCFSMSNVVPSGALNSAECWVKLTDAPLHVAACTDTMYCYTTARIAHFLASLFSYHPSSYVSRYVSGPYPKIYRSSYFHQQIR